MDKIKLGILGYGNLGKGVEIAIHNNPDTELVGIFTKRDPQNINTLFNDSKVFNVNEIESFKNKIDILIICSGSAIDTPIVGPQMAKLFNTIDSFDTHKRVPEYYHEMNNIAKENNNLSLISCGWDPGLFSIMRSLFESVLPTGQNYVFYGRGLSQGHSDAVRHIDGVIDAVQYTVPYEEAIKQVTDGKHPKFNSVRDMMWREVYAVVDENADKARIENEIKTMPNYFDEYNTEVHFITEEELKKNHSSMPHGGFVIRDGKTSDNTSQIAEFSLKLDSNPQFTASVLVAYARAIYRMKKENKTGAITVLDVPVSYLSTKSNEELLKGTI